MFRYVIISNTTGFISFSHYFEAIPAQLRAQLEKNAVEECLASGEKEGKVHEPDCILAYRREGVLLVLVSAACGTNHSSMQEFLHGFCHILTHHLHVVTEKCTIQKRNIIHEVLKQMVHGNVLETRVSHITALVDLHTSTNTYND